MLLKILFALLFALPAFAGPRCEFVHTLKSVDSTEKAVHHKFKRSERAPLKKVHFPTVEQAKKLFFRFDPKTNKIFGRIKNPSPEVLIGTLKISPEPYLYEWADHSSSVQWIKVGGIKKWEMDVILDDPPQSGGRGYYVSKNSSDSMSYGDAVTIFRPARELLVLDLNVSPHALEKSFLLKLGALGVDAIQVWHPTWLNMINHRALIDPVKFGGDYIFEVSGTFEGLKSVVEVTANMASPSQFQTKTQSRTEKELNSFVKKTGIDQSPYWKILDIFDIKYVAGIYAKQLLAEPVSLKNMHKIALQHAAKKNEQDLKAIDNLNDFIAVSSAIVGTSIEFRDYTAIMGPELKSKKDTLTIPKDLYKTINNNKFLKVDIEPNQNREYLDVTIEYPSIANYQQFRKVLSRELLEKLDAIPEEKMHTKKSQALNKELLRELTESLFDPGKQLEIVRTVDKNVSAVTPMGLYQAFVAIHPFKDGNGRSGRLFYEMIQLKNGSKEHLAELNLPIFDLDMFLPRPILQSTLTTGLALKMWVAESRSDSEFLERSVVALRALAEANATSYMVDIFPEAKQAVSP